MIRNIVRAVAIALIVLPEPFTTALGILILSATLAFPRRVSLKRFGDLEELLRRSLRDEELFGPGHATAAQRVVVHHVMRLDFEVPGTFEYRSWFDNRRVPRNVIHHVLRTSFPQFETLLDSGQEVSFAAEERLHSEPAVEYHTLKSSLATRPAEEPSSRAIVAPVFHHKLRTEFVPNLN